MHQPQNSGTGEASMQIIDAHHHLWDLGRYRYPWLAHGGRAAFGDYSRICRNYLVDDFLADVGELELIGSVHVQAEIDRSLSTDETAWLQEVADSGVTGIPHAIVAYADLSQPDAEKTLQAHSRFANLRGIRQILSRHSDPQLNSAPRDYLRDPTWVAQFGILQRFGLSFDLQIYYQQAADAVALARRYPEITFVLNHTGMPLERGSEHEEGWRRSMHDLAACDNVAVKISGLGMSDPAWTIERVRPFVEYTLEAFGTSRCMLGSNFPVDRLFGDYLTLWNTYSVLTAHLSLGERQAVFVDNAARYYRI
jgi:predicted TIM-barrel fold metal-dependent hydrolase